jgi:thioredoxin-like negative regulator of GroEL
MSRSVRLALLLTAALPAGAGATAQAISPGFELERSGRYADAATVYFTSVRSDPVNIPALLGLERTLFVLNRMPELLPLVQRARARAPETAALRSLELRVYAALNEPDSLEAVARRWARTAPQSEAPYREWGLALADHRRWDDAREAYLAGRSALGGDGTLAIELAELAQRTGNWEEAASEWGRAVAKSADVAPNAASQLAEAPSLQRERVIRVLTAPGASVRARRIGAEVLLVWGQPTDAWAALEPTLADKPDAQLALRRFADLAGSLATPEGHRVRGLALNRWADLVPSPLSERARAEAVRELLEGGDRAGARRVLEGLATDRHAPPEAHAVAQAALLDVLIADGQLDAVEQRLGQENGLTADDRTALRLALARARIARGELDRAHAALGADSSIAVIAQHGWIELYRGNLKGAMDAFRLAGPYATDRAAATERTAMLALLQRVETESSPELGAALLTLARGDTATAVAALRRAAYKLPVQGGRLEVLLLAGQAAARAGGPLETTAIGLFDEIARGGMGVASAALPAAELEWSRLLMRNGRASEAIPHLEHLILTYPNSAFVPEARRVLERARGAIPKS